MNTHRVSAKKIGLVTVVIALIVTYGLLILSGPDESPQQRRVRLLCETDHQALLKAGRLILSKGPKDPMNYRYYGLIDHGGLPVPRDVPIPRIIWKLEPHAVLINFDGCLIVGVGEGMADYGVKIYPEGFKRPRELFRYGNRELLPGLWYYDHLYRRDPEYNKTIDEIMQTGKWPEPNETDLDKSNPRG